MKVTLLVCDTLHIRTSVTSCGKASSSERATGTPCKRCPVGVAAAANKTIPDAWPDGKPIQYVETKVFGTLRKAETLPRRGQKVV